MSKFLKTSLCSAVLIMTAGLANANHVECSQDLNEDGLVNRLDAKILESAMGGVFGAAPYDERADVDGDGNVNSKDRAAYSHCTPPVPNRKR